MLAREIAHLDLSAPARSFAANILVTYEIVLLVSCTGQLEFCPCCSSNGYLEMQHRILIVLARQVPSLFALTRHKALVMIHTLKLSDRQLTGVSTRKSWASSEVPVGMFSLPLSLLGMCIK